MKINILALFALALSFTSWKSTALGSTTCGDIHGYYLEYEKEQRGLKAQTWKADFFIGYASASATWYAMTINLTTDKSAYPDKVNTAQIIKIYAKYLEQNPENHHLDGSICFMIAMKKAFP